MRDGFVRAAVATAPIRVGDPIGNARAIVEEMRSACANGARLVVFPELCLTGYTSGDLFLQRTLRESALAALSIVREATRGLNALVLVGLPLAVDARLYNVAAVLFEGAILGVVPKRNLPNYGEFYEMRHFSPGEMSVREIELLGETTPFGANILFRAAECPDFTVAVEICEDLWVPDSPGIAHALAGASVLCNLSASDETVGKRDYRRELIRSQSAKLVAGYLYADAGAGESSTDLVFAAHNMIAENGSILAESAKYATGAAYAELDVAYLMNERLRMNTFGARPTGHTLVEFAMRSEETPVTRAIDPMPFVPGDPGKLAKHCEEVLDIQVHALATRLKHTGIQSALLGLSGGLDSTLALIVTARAFDLLGLPRGDIRAVTMPCFGTTSRTYGNAVKLARGVGAQLLEINIRDAVAGHFRDIGHDPSVQDVTYENAQARERTQVLMDLSNQLGGLVVGTGDLSELALGWATYNGDHMSMYGVNAGVPKTLIRHLVGYAATLYDGEMRAALTDVLHTPVSPELLPPKDGEISQVTEDLVGPYELHDFFLYHLVRRMATPEKILRLANIAFDGRYTPQTIEKWLRVFLKRFFQQQFKRSCMPDGPKVGSVALSPRGDWRMPSDAVNSAWIGNLDS